MGKSRRQKRPQPARIYLETPKSADSNIHRFLADYEARQANVQDGFRSYLSPPPAGESPDFILNQCFLLTTFGPKRCKINAPTGGWEAKNKLKSHIFQKPPARIWDLCKIICCRRQIHPNLQHHQNPNQNQCFSGENLQC